MPTESDKQRTKERPSGQRPTGRTLGEQPRIDKNSEANEQRDRDRAAQPAATAHSCSSVASQPAPSGDRRREYSGRPNMRQQFAAVHKTVEYWLQEVTVCRLLLPVFD